MNRNYWAITTSKKFKFFFLQDSSSLTFCKSYRKTLGRFRTLASKPNKVFICPRRGWFLYYSRQHPTDRRQLSTCVKVPRPGLQHWAERWRHDWLLDGNPPRNWAHSHQWLPFSQREIRGCQEEWFIQVGVFLAQLDANIFKLNCCKMWKTFTQVTDGKLQIGQKELGKFKHSLNWSRPQRWPDSIFSSSQYANIRRVYVDIYRYSQTSHSAYISPLLMVAFIVHGC